MIDRPEFLDRLLESIDRLKRQWLPHTVPNAADSIATAGGLQKLKSGEGIVPRRNVAGQTFTLVIAIMAFLASLAVGAANIVSGTASNWNADVAREVTIQIRPSTGIDMENAIREASRLVLTFDGVSHVTALDDTASAKLLEPWLGAGLDLKELPVPRLLTVALKANGKPDFAAIRAALKDKVPSASLDDHRTWLERLTRMAWTMAAIALAVMVLVLVATTLTVVFATRGAMVGNRDIIEVLHFVGAEPGFIARQFQRHFWALGMKGAAAGALAAAALFVALALWSTLAPETPERDQVDVLFGSFSLRWSGYFGIAAIAGAVAALAAATSRYTVLSHIGGMNALFWKRNTED